METSTKLRVLFVCHGNICRSPMAEFYFRRLVANEGLADCIEVASAATSNEEIGNPVYPLAKRILATRGIGCKDKVAQVMTRTMFDDSDYVIGMDSQNITNIMLMVGDNVGQKLHRLLDFVESHDGKEPARNIADPWYTRNFEKAWQDITLGCKALLGYLKEHEAERIARLKAGSDPSPIAVC